MKRRHFLTRAPLAVAAVAAPVAAAEGLALPSPTPTENPALLALGDDLPKVEQAYQDAMRAWKAMWAKWSPQWPLAPEACCNKWGSGDKERNLSGAALVRKGEPQAWSIKTPEQLEKDLAWSRDLLAKDDKRKRSYGKSYRQYRYNEIAEAELGLSLLPGYLAEIERISTESNFAAIDGARMKARRDLFAFVRKVLAEPSRTTAGLTIKAQACATLTRMHSYDRVMGNMGDSIDHDENMVDLLAKAMLEVLKA